MNLIRNMIQILLRIETTLNLIHLHVKTHEAVQVAEPLPTGETWLDKQDVLQKLHISERTLLRLRQENKLPCSRLNRKLYYRLSDIEKLLKGAIPVD